jgi:hypothetical protein
MANDFSNSSSFASLSDIVVHIPNSIEHDISNAVKNISLKDDVTALTVETQTIDDSESLVSALSEIGFFSTPTIRVEE